MQNRWRDLQPSETTHLPDFRSQTPPFAATGIFCHPAGAVNLSRTADEVGSLHLTVRGAELEMLNQT